MAHSTRYEQCLVPDMRAMRVVVAAGEVVVRALVPILVPVVGLVQVAVGAGGSGGSSAAAAGGGGGSASGRR
ncbi:hypothetical protein EMCRGX_G010836 [Ephydatia muelleri]